MSDEQPLIEKRAADPNLTAYRDPSTGQIQFYPKTTDAKKLEARQIRGLVPAAPKDIAERSAYLKSTTTMGQLKAAGKLGANAATFGLAGFNSPEDLQDIKNFRAESPTIAGQVEAVGTLGPGLALGAATGGVAPALGLGANAARAAALLVETGAQSTSAAIEHATEEHRSIDPGEIVMGMGLAVGMSAAARLARSGLSRVTGRAAAAGVEDLEAAAAPERNMLGRAVAETGERRRAPARGPKSVGAQAAREAKPRPAERAEVEHYAEHREAYHAQTNQLAGDAIEDLVGGQTPAFDEVMTLRNKFGDSVGKMGDADEKAIAFEVEQHSAGLQELADNLEASNAKAVAAEVREFAARLEDAWESGEHENLKGVHVEGTGAVLDEAKRYVDRLRTKYAAHTTAIGDPSGQKLAEIDRVLEPMRDSLEKKEIWGEWFGERQHSENKRFWTGPDGLINTGAVWMNEFLDRLPGPAGTARRAAGRDAPVFRVRGDIVQHLVGMTQRRFVETVNAATTWIEKAEGMMLEKVERKATSTESTPVVRMQTGLNEMRTAFEEAAWMRNVEHTPGVKSLLEKARVKAASHGLGEQAYELLHKIPGTKHAIEGLDVASKAATGKPLKEHLFETKLGTGEPRFTRDEAKQLIRGRQNARQNIGRPKPPRTPPPASPPAAGAVGAPGAGKVAGAAGAIGAAGALLAAPDARATEPPETTALAQLGENSRAIRQRAAYGLVAPDSRAPALSPVISRFQGDAPTLRAAYLDHVDQLDLATRDPRAFTAAMAEAYGNLHDAHPDIFGAIVSRTMVGVHYMLANMPPSVGISMTRPDGIPPDSIAVSQFAALWSGAFAPGDVVHDVGTGTATPSQVRALREVHPDVYGKLRTDVLMALGEVSDVPFETKRRLDVLFQLDGAAGPSFSSKFANLLAQANAAKPGRQGSPANQSLAAPESPTKVFRQGPTYSAA